MAGGLLLPLERLGTGSTVTAGLPGLDGETVKSVESVWPLDRFWLGRQ